MFSKKKSLFQYSLLACTLSSLPLNTLAASPTLEKSVATQIPGRDLRTNPPKTSSVTVTPMGIQSGLEKGLLKVQFEEVNLPKALDIIYQEGIVTLHDDGLGDDAAKDGIYSALINIDLNELVNHQVQLKSSGTPSSVQALATTSPTELTAAALTASTNLDAEKTLFIRDLSVVNNSFRTSDPCKSTSVKDSTKKWTFGYLLTQMANTSKTGKSPHDLAMSILSKWETSLTVNGDIVPARAAIRTRVTDPWLRASGNTGRLAMNKAPFRLLGIVNRVDLRQNLFFGEGLAGELRFVWGVLDLDTKVADGSCQIIPNFTFIMEYAVDRSNAASAKAYAQKWVDLNTMTLNSGAYRDSLQKITESVVKADAGLAFGRANGSEIIRMRTNEIALAGPWELREFNIAKAPRADAGLFFQVDTKQTPANKFNHSTTFAKYVNQNEAQILAGTNIVPLVFDSVPFRGGHSTNQIDFWSAPGIVNNEARHLVSLNTCNGCHGREVRTTFLQVNPRARASVAVLAGFLTGETVQDPVVPTVTRTFNDLDRRAIDLNSLVSSPTISQLSFTPSNFTH